MTTLPQGIDTLLIDIDGVFFNWARGFCQYMASIGFESLHDNPTKFTMTDIFPQLEKPWEHIMDFQHSPFYRGLETYPEIEKALYRVKALGVNIIAVSSCGTTEVIQRVRREDLAKYNLFNDVVMLDLGAAKTEVLAQYPRAVFVDDQIEVAAQGMESGHISFVADMPYNQTPLPDGLYRLKEPNELVRLFESAKVGT
jgi:hypothetical protein